MWLTHKAPHNFPGPRGKSSNWLFLPINTPKNKKEYNYMFTIILNKFLLIHSFLPFLWQVFSRWLVGLYGTPPSLVPVLPSLARPRGLPFCSSRGSLAGGALASAMLLTSSEFSLPKHVSLRCSIILSTSAHYHLGEAETACNQLPGEICVWHKRSRRMKSCHVIQKKQWTQNLLCWYHWHVKMWRDIFIEQKKVL